jgi:hypothetical protein
VDRSVRAREELSKEGAACICVQIERGVLRWRAGRTLEWLERCARDVDRSIISLRHGNKALNAASDTPRPDSRCRPCTGSEWPERTTLSSSSRCTLHGELGIATVAKGGRTTTITVSPNLPRVFSWPTTSPWTIPGAWLLCVFVGCTYPALPLHSTPPSSSAAFTHKHAKACCHASIMDSRARDRDLPKANQPYVT